MQAHQMDYKLASIFSVSDRCQKTRWSLRFANFYAKLHYANGSLSLSGICSQNRAWANWLRFGNASGDSHATRSRTAGRRFAALHASLAANEAATCASGERQKDLFFGARATTWPTAATVSECSAACAFHYSPYAREMRNAVMSACVCVQQKLGHSSACAPSMKPKRQFIVFRDARKQIGKILGEPKSRIDAKPFCFCFSFMTVNYFCALREPFLETFELIDCKFTNF